jgi:hypothetical protein
MPRVQKSPVLRADLIQSEVGVFSLRYMEHVMRNATPSEKNLMMTKHGVTLERTIHMNRVVPGAVTALLALSIAAACGSGDARLVGPVTPSAPASISVATTATRLASSSTLSMHAVALDASGDTVPAMSFTWNSSNPQVAAVSADGTLTGALTGTTSITASAGAITSNAFTMTVTAGATVNTIVLTAPSYLLAPGQTAQAQAVAYDASGNAMDGFSFTWTSSNPLVATVSSTGLVTAQQGGITRVTAVTNSRTSPAVKFTVTP